MTPTGSLRWLLQAFFVLLLSVASRPESSNNQGELGRTEDAWLDKLLGKSKQGVYEADFEEENGTTISVRDGDTAILSCRVYLVHDKTVSWLRHREGTIELLTVGDNTYSGDSRINVSYLYPNNWRLNITNVHKSDGGRYVCQISSFPPKALVTFLYVKDALVEIVDNDGKTMDTQYYNPGSEIELGCVIRNRSHWATEAVWLKDEQPLDLYHRPTVSIGTQVEAEHVLSRLWIGGAERSDTGNYTCSIPGHKSGDFPRAVVRVHVVDGDFHAAVHGGVDQVQTCIWLLYLLLVLYTLTDYS